MLNNGEITHHYFISPSIKSDMTLKKEEKELNMIPIEADL